VEGQSIYKLAGDNWKKFGYVSWDACEFAIREAFHKNELTVRTVSEAVTLGNRSRHD
jgi:hypothetical protein